MATGAGTPTLIPIIPVCALALNSRAACPDLVKIEEELPYSEAFTTSRASYKFFALTTDSTGPKVASRAMRIEGFALSKIVGPTKYPSDSQHASLRPSRAT